MTFNGEEIELGDRVDDLLADPAETGAVKSIMRKARFGLDEDGSQLSPMQKRRHLRWHRPAQVPIRPVVDCSPRALLCLSPPCRAQPRSMRMAARRRCLAHRVVPSPPSLAP